MLLVEKHTTFFADFLGCCHQTQYSIFQCEFQLRDLKEICWWEILWVWKLWVMCDVVYEQVTSNSRGMNVQDCFYGGASVFFPTWIWPFSFHCLSQAFHHFKVVLIVDIMAMKCKFMVYNTCINKQNTQSTSPSLLTELAMIFLFWEMFLAATHLIPKFSVKILRHNFFEMPASSGTSSLSNVYLNGRFQTHPELGESSIEFPLSLSVYPTHKFEFGSWIHYQTLSVAFHVRTKHCFLWQTQCKD
jgi:hypothetical protein